MREYLKKNPIITSILTALITLAFYYIFQFTIKMNIWTYTIRELIVGIFVLYIIYLVAGKKAIKWSSKGISFCFKKCWWLILILSLQALLFLAAYFKTIIQANAFTYFESFIIGGIFTFFIGIFEEGLFRGLLLNATLYYWGNTKSDILKACLLNAFLFGLLHITASIISGEFSDIIAWLTGILKVVQAGSIGFLFAILYLRTRSLYGVVLIHALNDYIPFVLSLLANVGIDTSYVNTGTEGIIEIIGFIIILILYIPLIIVAVRQIKYIELPQESFFIKFTPAHSILKTE